MIKQATINEPVYDREAGLVYSPGDVEVIDCATGKPLVDENGLWRGVVTANTNSGLLVCYVRDQTGRFKYDHERNCDVLVTEWRNDFEIRPRADEPHLSDVFLDD